MQNILLSCMILLSFYKIKKKCHICYKYKQILVEPLPYFVGEVYFYIVVFNCAKKLKVLNVCELPQTKECLAIKKF